MPRGPPQRARPRAGRAGRERARRLGDPPVVEPAAPCPRDAAPIAERLGLEVEIVDDLRSCERSRLRRALRRGEALRRWSTWMTAHPETPASPAGRRVVRDLVRPRVKAPCSRPADGCSRSAGIFLRFLLPCLLGEDFRPAQAKHLGSCEPQLGLSALRRRARTRQRECSASPDGAWDRLGRWLWRSARIVMGGGGRARRAGGRRARPSTGNGASSARRRRSRARRRHAGLAGSKRGRRVLRRRVWSAHMLHQQSLLALCAVDERMLAVVEPPDVLPALGAIARWGW